VTPQLHHFVIGEQDMRAKKVSRVVGFVFVVAAIGGIGATAWGSETEPAPAPGGTVTVDRTPGTVSPTPSRTGGIHLFGVDWG
jgi:hypothetical protein